MSSAKHPDPPPIRDSDILSRAPDYLLEQVAGEYQLRHRGHDTAVFINTSAALLWELCDGSRKVGAIKALLRDAYPDAAQRLGAEVDDALAMLRGHGALRLTTRRAGS